MPGYDKDQVAFVVDDPTTTFGIQVPIVLGTPTIDRVIATMPLMSGRHVVHPTTPHEGSS